MFDFAVMAVPFDHLARLLPASPEAEPLRQALERFETSPITGIHLWFDRQISNLDHAVLLDRTVQWMFHKSRLLETNRKGAVSPSPSGAQDLEENQLRRGEEGFLGRRGVAPEGQNRKLDTPSSGSYVELVVSSSRSLLEKPRSEIIDLALAELREFFPSARGANLVKATVIKEVHATYSPRPGIDLYRPATSTPWPRVFLAGDWTATGWPATMEGAVRSGYLAAETIARVTGLDNRTYLVSDLLPRGFMRFFG